MWHFQSRRGQHTWAQALQTRPHPSAPGPHTPYFGSSQWQQLPLLPRDRKAALIPGWHESGFCGREEKSSRNAQSMIDMGLSHT